MKLHSQNREFKALRVAFMMSSDKISEYEFFVFINFFTAILERARIKPIKSILMSITSKPKTFNV